MKKKVFVLTIVSVVFAVLTLGMIFGFPLVSGFSKALYGSAGYGGFADMVLAKIPSTFSYIFEFNGKVHSSFVLFALALFVGLVLFVVHLVAIIRKKSGKSVALLIISLLLFALAGFYAAITFRAGLLTNEYGVVYNGKSAIFGYIINLRGKTSFGFLYMLLTVLPYLSAFLSIVCIMYAQISDVVYLHNMPEYELSTIRDDVDVEGDEEQKQIHQLLNDELAKAKDGNAIVTPLGDASNPYRGPILVQYINTYDPKATGPVVTSKPVEKENKNPVPKEEKPLSADDIRRIFQEEFTRREDSKALKEAKRNEKPAAEDIKATIKEEMATYAEKQAALEAENAKVLAEKEREIRIAEEEARRLKMEKEAAEEALASLRSQEVKAQNAQRLSEEEVRSIIGAELDKKEQPSGGKSLSADDIRAIIRAELADFKKEQNVSQVSKGEDMEEKKIEAAVVEKEVPVAPAKRVVGAFNPNLPPHDKIIRIAFPTRMLNASDEMKSNYNELKAEILSYGCKSRLSNSGDTFRLHAVTFLKMTIAGNSLKLYLALNPDDYAKSTIPVTSVAHKHIYKDIPCVFKVKSDLSMKRAKRLIADVMTKHGLTQGKVTPNNYAAEMKDYVAQGSVKEEAKEEE